MLYISSDGSFHLNNNDCGDFLTLCSHFSSTLVTSIIPYNVYTSLTIVIPNVISSIAEFGPEEREDTLHRAYVNSTESLWRTLPQPSHMSAATENVMFVLDIPATL